MNSVIKFVVGCTIGAGAFVYNQQAPERVKKAYNITPVETQFFDQCRTTMKRHEITYKQGASVDKGCACMTKNVMSTFERKEIPMVTTYMKELFGVGKANISKKMSTSDAEAKFQSINEKHQISDNDALGYTLILGGAMASCGKKSYHSKTNVQRLAAMTPKPEVIVKKVKPKVEIEKKPVKTEPSVEKEMSLRGLSKG